MDAVIMSRMTMPPIVGVPCLTRWPWGPSARTCCPIWRTLSNLMKNGMTIMVSAIDMMKARKT